jgi:hypothetical protein
VEEFESLGEREREVFQILKGGARKSAEKHKHNFILG